MRNKLDAALNAILSVLLVADEKQRLQSRIEIVADFTCHQITNQDSRELINRRC